MKSAKVAASDLLVMWMIDGVKVGWVLGALEMWAVHVWTVRQLVESVNDCLVLDGEVVGVHVGQIPLSGY